MCRSYGERSRRTSREIYKDFIGSQGEATTRETNYQWLRDEPQVSVRGLLEQGPTATEEAASLADRQFWQREDKIELRCCSTFLATEQSRKPGILR